MAACLALGPVADVVLPDHTVGPGHADQCSEIDKNPLQPQWAVIGAMNKAPVHAKRVAETHGYCGRGEKKDQRPPSKIDWPDDQCDKRHAGDPRGLAELTVPRNAD